jgi:O-antigen ligase
LAGFAVISASALLGADLRKGEWPSDVYYGSVGGVSNYLVTVGPVLVLTVALFGRRHSRKWLAILGLAFGAVALLSAQRALWPALGLQAALGCVWLWRVRAVAVDPVRLAVTGTILLALIGSGIYVSDQYRTGGNPESPVAMGNDLRPHVWKKVGEEILAHPLSGAGFGLGVMSKAYPTLLPAEGKVFWHPHNLVLNYGISAGVPGMVAVLALFAALAWRFWQLALRGERLARLAGLAGAAMVAGVLARNMANDFFVRDGALLFWALAGMLFGYALRRGSTSGDDQAGLRQEPRGIVVAEA